MKLNNKVAVVTGGSSGIGLSMAQLFKEEGATVAICGRTQKNLDSVQEQLGSDVYACQTDVSNISALEDFYQKVEKKFGKIDILVANAGISKVAPLEQIDECFFDELVNINFKSVFFTVKNAIPHLNEGASIILISSHARVMGLPVASVYSATKAAVRSLAQTFSAELITRHIRVNSISPGPTDTPIFDKLCIPEEAKNALKGMIPIGRFGFPREIAATALFLASDDSRFIIGEDIIIDGGWVNLDVVNQNISSLD